MNGCAGTFRIRRWASSAYFSGQLSLDVTAIYYVPRLTFSPLTVHFLGVLRLIGPHQRTKVYSLRTSSWSSMHKPETSIRFVSIRADRFFCRASGCSPINTGRSNAGESCRDLLSGRGRCARHSVIEKDCIAIEQGSLSHGCNGKNPRTRGKRRINTQCYRSIPGPLLRAREIQDRERRLPPTSTNR